MGDFLLGAEGGNRTRTRGEPYRILSPARLPVSPPRQYGYYLMGFVVFVRVKCIISDKHFRA